MQTTIVARVADYIRDPDARKKIDKSAGKTPTPSSDKVVLSEEGRKKASDIAQYESDWEKQRAERVDAVKEQVQSKNYRFTPEVVDRIAARLAQLF